MNWQHWTARALEANRRDNRTGYAWSLKLQAMHAADIRARKARTEKARERALAELADWTTAPVAAVAEG